MATLTWDEGVVIDAIRAMSSEFPDGVPALSIRDRVLESHGVNYDAANRALKGLVDKGVAVKPKRGYYMSARTR